MPASETEVYQAQELWRHIFDEERGLLHIFAARRDGEKLLDPRIAHYNYPKAAKAAAEWALEKSNEGREVFFCAHLLMGPERTKKNAAAVRALWCDLDGVPVPDNTFVPSVVVKTSPGHHHVYWLLEDAIPPETAEQLNKRLAQKVGADPSGFDLSQLLRVPGTKNYKYPGSPTVEVIHTTESAYSPAALDKQLPKIEERKSAAPVEDRIAIGGRNKELTSLAGSMRRRGMEEEEIAVAILAVNERRCDPPLEEAEVRKIARSVAGYEPEKVVPINLNGLHSHSRSPYIDGNGGNGGIIHPKNHLRAVSFTRRAKPPPQNFLVEGLLPEGLPATLYGTGGLAKSANVLHLGLSVAFAGVEDWHDLKIGTCPVIYLDFEMNEATQLGRSQEIATGAGWPDVPVGFRYIEAVGFTADEVFRFTVEQLEELGRALVIIDSYGFALQGESERSGDVLDFHRRYIEPIQAAGGTPLTVDHVSRVIKGERAEDKDPFGSAYKSYASRSVVHVTGHVGDAGEVYTTFTHKKCNVGPQLGPFTVVTKFSHDAITFERSSEVIRPPVAPTTKQKIVAVLDKENLTVSEIAAKIEAKPKTVSNEVAELKKEGVVEETGEKREGAHVLRLHSPRSRTYRGMGTGMDDEDEEALA